MSARRQRPAPGIRRDLADPGERDTSAAAAINERLTPQQSRAPLSLSPRRVLSRLGCLCSLGAGIVGRRASPTSLVRPGAKNDQLSQVVSPDLLLRRRIRLDRAHAGPPADARRSAVGRRRVAKRGDPSRTAELRVPACVHDELARPAARKRRRRAHGFGTATEMASPCRFAL
jgi:hypothetical protein